MSGHTVVSILGTYLLCMSSCCSKDIFNVSVYENATNGTAILDIQPLKAALSVKESRCMVEGDPYRRFEVSGGTLFVSNPLDYGVQSEYVLHVTPEQYEGRVTVRVQVVDVPGYPPVFNTSCDIPARDTYRETFVRLTVSEKGNRYKVARYGNESIGKYVRVDIGNNKCEMKAAFNGACRCSPGWQGVICDIPKQELSIISTPRNADELYITRSVTLQCQEHHVNITMMRWSFQPETQEGSLKPLDVKNGQKLKIVSLQPENNGMYICQAHTLEGNVLSSNLTLNVTTCPANHHGWRCNETCNCLHGAYCDRWDGCVCPNGFRGDRCEHLCEPGSYGLKCERSCSCKNGAYCSPSDGTCNCTTGWRGTNCSQPCEKGKFGHNCQSVCTCKNNATCHHVDGSCTCVSPWSGSNCDVIEKLDLQSSAFISVSFVLVFIAFMGIVAYNKKLKLTSVYKHHYEEEQALCELRKLEEDLADSYARDGCSAGKSTAVG
ncbi:Endothelial cell-specific molecule 1 [Branchiostoma belcheri]|nr:Endothelial cell-specific molecule 1 [Branchiostoma belcheri]